jgi:hypothetical protein
MLLIVLALALIAAGAMVIAVVSTNAAIAWLCVAASLVGLVLMVFDALRERDRHTAELAAEAPVLAYDAHYPDYGPHDRPAHDAPIHDDHEVEREIVREEEVLHPDTGPREPDISRLRAFETMDGDHFRAGKDRGKRS